MIDFRTKDYRVIERELSAAGFTNIQSIVLNDLMIGLLKKPGIVESLSVNGETNALQGARFLPDVLIIISYHDFIEKR